MQSDGRGMRPPASITPGRPDRRSVRPAHCAVTNRQDRRPGWRDRGSPPPGTPRACHYQRLVWQAGTVSGDDASTMGAPTKTPAAGPHSAHEPSSAPANVLQRADSTAEPNHRFHPRQAAAPRHRIGDPPLVGRRGPGEGSSAEGSARRCGRGTATAALPAAQLVSRSLRANWAGVRIGRSSLRTSRSRSPVTR